MKKSITVMIFVFAFGFLLNIDTVIAKEQFTEVKIDEINFPDEHVRDAIYDTADQNADSILQPREIEKTKKISISSDRPKRKDYSYTIINLKGLRVFKNLETLTLYSDGKWDKKSGFSNIEEIYHCKNLKYVTIIGDTTTKKYEFNKLKNLKQLYLISVKSNEIVIRNESLNKLHIEGLEVKSLRLNKLKKIKILEMSLIKTNVLDLSNMKNLKKLEISFSEFKKLKLGKLHKLKSFHIYMYGTKLKNIDISGLKNVEDVSIFDIKNLEKIKIGNLKKLKELHIVLDDGHKNKKLKKLDISGLKNLKNFQISAYTKLKKLKINEDQKFKYFCIENCKNLKSVDMKNVRITKHIIVDRRVKLVNFNQKNKKYLKRI